MSDIIFKIHSDVITLKAEQQLNTSIERAWNFICNPSNLAKITPPKMNFRITSPFLPKEIYPGLIITYKVTPMLGISTNWVTEITQVNKHVFFIDEQRFGPYKFWHHEHHISSKGSNVLMTDVVSFKLPFNNMFGLRFVKKQLHHIFTYRNNVLNNIFNKESTF